MLNFSAILSDLQSAIARRAACDRTLTVLLVAMWGRIARMRTRLERLVALWRAGALPKARGPRARQDARSRAGKPAARPPYPTTPAWLLRQLGYEVAGFGSQLRHMLSDQECTAFLAAVPQAGRILRPLLGMLSIDPAPEVIRMVKPVAPRTVILTEMVEGEVGGGPGISIFSGRNAG